MARRANEAGVSLIKEFETLQLKAYPDPATGGDPWTIGWGHTGDVRPGSTITQHQAEAVLDVDLDKFERGVEGLLAGASVSDNAFSALVSFAFNLGLANLKSSTLMKKVRAGDMGAAANEFSKWVYAAGKKMRGLERRRKAEAALFIS